MPPRRLELSLLVLGAVITGLAYFQLDAAEKVGVQFKIGVFFAVILGLLIGAHMVIRLVAPNADGLLLPLAALLNGIGYVEISRLNANLAGNQAAWTFIGIGAFAATLILLPDPRRLADYRYSLGLLGVGMLLLPLVPGLGRTINGARIWLRAGPFSIQPAEFSKIVLAMFLAGYLTEKRELMALANRRLGPLHVPDLKFFGPVLLGIGMALVINVAQKDLGTSLLFFALFMVMLYVATGRAAYVGVGLVLFGGASVLSWQLFAHVQRRVDIWLHPFADPRNKGFQIVEAWFAMADGGITGTGLGQGLPNKIPFAATDMIFAAIAEELGLLGATAVLTAFLFFVAAGFRVAASANQTFEKLLATGLTALLGFQGFIIVGGALRVLPLTGVTLPFVSYGGSSLISNYVILALLVRISDSSARQAAAKAAATAQPVLV